MLLASLLYLAGLTAASSSPAQSANPFSSMAFVVGSCWTGTFPDGKQTDEHCFEWVFDRKFIRDRHVVRGGTPYEGETLYYWDAPAKRVAFHYWNSAGDLFDGHADAGNDGPTFLQSSAPGAAPDIRAHWTPVNADAYRVDVSQKSGDTWKPLWTMEMHRTRR